MVSNRPDHVAQSSVERMAGLSEDVGWIPTVVRQCFQPTCSVVFTKSSTLISVVNVSKFEWKLYTLN